MVYKNIESIAKWYVKNEDGLLKLEGKAASEMVYGGVRFLLPKKPNPMT